jgi:lambda repressor-like predicted transcriptional regulator
MKNLATARKATRPSDMPPIELRIAMMRAQIGQRGLARKLGVSQAAIWRVMQGRSTSHRIRTAIAESVGLDIARIWPSIYIYGGGPRKAGRPRKNG